MKQITEEQAIQIAESELWKDWSNKEIVEFQLFQRRLAMPFSRFHEAVEKVFKRPVYTHEFANQQRLIDEFLGDREPPSFDEIIEMIPEEKRMIIIMDS